MSINFWRFRAKGINRFYEMRGFNMSETSYFLEPIQFFNSSYFLSGKFEDMLPENTEIIKSLVLAMELENEIEMLPDGYQVWRDAITEAGAMRYCTDKGMEGDELLDPELEGAWVAVEPYLKELQKKKLKKIITEKEIFWFVLAYDILEILKSVSVGRYVFGENGEPFFEGVYKVLKAGFYPCGIKNDGSLVAFDPSVLQDAIGTGVFEW